MTYQEFIKHYFQQHKGSDPKTIMKRAAAAWDAQKDGGGGSHKRKSSSSHRRSPASCASTIVPTADGSDVTTRAGGHLRANFEGHTKVEFDQAALGAVWSGIVERLRQSGGANLAAMFPDVYPEANLAMAANRMHADERVIGNQMAPLLGAMIVAYRVTPEEWAAWYALASQQRFIIPAQGSGLCVTVGAALTAGGLPQGLPPGAALPQGGMGGVLGAPAGAVLPGGNFGTLRGQ